MAKPGRPRKVVEPKKIDMHESCNKCKDKVCVSKEAIDDCRISKNELLKELADRDIEIEEAMKKAEETKNKFEELKLDFNSLKSEYFDLLDSYEKCVDNNAYLLNKIEDLKVSLILWLILSFVATGVAFYLWYFA